MIGQRQIVEGDTLLNQRVCADHDMNAAFGQSPRKFPARSGFIGIAGQQPDLNLIAARRLAQQPADTAEVLFGQDAGRSHERGLFAVLDGHRHRGRRHDRFARSDIALQQAVHRQYRGR